MEKLKAKKRSIKKAQGNKIEAFEKAARDLRNSFDHEEISFNLE